MSTSDPESKQFTRLWVSAQPAVSAYILSTVRNATDADDLLHDVAESALEHFNQYDPQRSFTGWVLGIARNRILNHFRTQRSDRHVFGEQALAILASAHERVDHRKDEIHVALRQCTSALSDDHQRLLALRYRDDVPVKRIAENAGSTAHAVSNVLHRIRQRLADCVRRRLGDEGGANLG